jgi:hypothetical protein
MCPANQTHAEHSVDALLHSDQTVCRVRASWKKTWGIFTAQTQLFLNNVEGKEKMVENQNVTRPDGEGDKNLVGK